MVSTMKSAISLDCSTWLFGPTSRCRTAKSRLYVLSFADMPISILFSVEIAAIPANIGYMNQPLFWIRKAMMPSRSNIPRDGSRHSLLPARSLPSASCDARIIGPGNRPVPRSRHVLVPHHLCSSSVFNVCMFLDVPPNARQED